MLQPSLIHRRHFVKLGTLAAAATLLPTAARAATATPAVAPFALPALGYAFDALEPHIDKLTMEIHHDKHHAAYIANLNAALAT
ncbi:MAG: superoxide dismutase, partial [Verrucomicrobia bacterium]